MKSQFVFIATYPALAKLAEEVCTELHKNWIIDVGDLEDGVKKARYYEAQGAKIIVSRSGTALAISKNVSIPVIDVGVSPYDIIQAVANSKLKDKKIGIVGYYNTIYGSRFLSCFLDRQIIELHVENSAEVPNAIDEAIANGVEVIMGGKSSTAYAETKGIESILLTTGKNSISSAFFRAEEMADLLRQNEIRTGQLKTILDFSFEGIIITEEHDKIIFMNKTAQTMLGAKDASIIGTVCTKSLPFLDWESVKLSKKESIGNLCRVGQNALVQNITPVIIGQEMIGMVMNLQYAQNIENIETKVRKELYQNGHLATRTFDQFITQNPVMLSIIKQAKRYAAVDSNILITGDTGTGKEVMAQSIHNASRRRGKPFVAINCASIPESLLESELFGYESGAFTGARKNGKKGYFEMANGGTLFLDEIGELPENLQATLLRAVQERVIMRIGGDKVIPVDIRIIAATHKNLKRAAKEGKFRQDLLYRLDVLRIMLPPLRERPEDIAILSEILLQQKADKLSLPRPKLAPETIALLQQYPWEGNIRELENVLERLLILQEGDVIRPEEVQTVMNGLLWEDAPEVQTLPFKGTLEEIEIQVITAAMKEYHNNREKVCEALGISQSTLWRRLKEINSHT